MPDAGHYLCTSRTACDIGQNARTRVTKGNRYSRPFVNRFRGERSTRRRHENCDFERSRAVRGNFRTRPMARHDQLDRITRNVVHGELGVLSHEWLAGRREYRKYQKEPTHTASNG